VRAFTAPHSSPPHLYSALASLAQVHRKSVGDADIEKFKREHETDNIWGPLDRGAIRGIGRLPHPQDSMLMTRKSPMMT
jgi:hypothetical protein